MSDLKSELASDPVLRPVLLKFVKGLPERARLIEEAFQKQNQTEFLSQAHRLKGAAGSYGFGDLRELASEIEIAGEKDLRDARLQVLIERLQKNVLGLAASEVL